MCLAQAMYHEARGEDEIGMIAVGSVIMRRAHYDERRVCSVIHKPYQFSYLGKAKAAKPDDLIPFYFIAWKVSKGYYSDPTHGATHYCHTRLGNPWKMKLTAKIGNHYFYKDTYGNRDILRTNHRVRSWF